MDIHGDNLSSIKKNLLKNTIDQDIAEEVYERLDDWTIEKKKVTQRIAPNKKHTGEKKFDIMPWSIWWYQAGENIGSETGSHVSLENLVTYKRPCVVISKLKSLIDTNHSIVTILPLTSKSSGIGINSKFLHKLESANYPSAGYLKGLKQDSYVICNQIKSIDTKRLTEHVTKRLTDEDVDKIKEVTKRYIDI